MDNNEVKIITITDKHLRSLISEAVQDGIKTVATSTINEPTISPKELASRFGCSVQHIYNQVNREEIPYLRVGDNIMFLYSEVVEHCRANGKVPPAGSMEDIVSSRR